MPPPTSIPTIYFELLPPTHPPGVNPSKEPTSLPSIPQTTTQPTPGMVETLIPNPGSGANDMALLPIMSIAISLIFLLY